MKKEILLQLQRLGGDISKVKHRSLQEDLEAISFPHPLYPKSENWLENLYGVKDFFEKHQALYLENQAKFFETLLEHFFSDHEIPYGQMFFRNQHFTPFKEGTADFEEFRDWFTDEADLSEVRKIVADETPEFILIASSYGFPDHFYICLSDPNPDNPTVFGTDHEVFFTEISNRGTLEDFFNDFLTKEEFLGVVKDFIQQGSR
jgi:hypothetical protein